MRYSSSLYEIGKPKKGETIFISAASGAVGSIVGQLAKREGLRVIGSAGSDEKVAYIKKELNFDEAFNYKSISTDEALKKYAPDGIDIYYDNVGGEALDAALAHGNKNARFIECGMISQYNIADPKDAYPIRNIEAVVPKRYTIRVSYSLFPYVVTPSTPSTPFTHHIRITKEPKYQDDTKVLGSQDGETYLLWEDIPNIPLTIIAGIHRW